jgi:hypothetical protein
MGRKNCQNAANYAKSHCHINALKALEGRSPAEISAAASKIPGSAQSVKDIIAYTPLSDNMKALLPAELQSVPPSSSPETPSTKVADCGEILKLYPNKREFSKKFMHLQPDRICPPLGESQKERWRKEDYAKNTAILECHERANKALRDAGFRCYE